MNLSRSGPQDPSKFDLMSTAMHEINEVLGFGSALNLPVSFPRIPLPQDLFRYDGSGNRSYTTGTSAQAFFSIDGTPLLNQLTQSGSGDYGDWIAHNPSQVQDNSLLPNQRPDLNTSEFTNL